MKLIPLMKKIYDIPIGHRVKVNLWFIPLLICAFLGNYQALFLIAYSSSFLHELAHIFTAKSLGVDISYIKIYPFGISAKLKNNYIQSSEKEFWIAFAGPFCSFVIFFVALTLDGFLIFPYNDFIIETNFALCFINLIPCLPLDGGRIAKSLLSIRFGIIRAYNLMIKFSNFVLIVLTSSAFVFLYINKFNFSLLLIYAFLFQNLANEQKSISILTLKEILNTKNKCHSADILFVRNLCVFEEKNASSILRHLSYDYFLIVSVIDKNSTIIKTLTEPQIINAIIKNGVRTKYKDI